MSEEARPEKQELVEVTDEPTGPEINLDALMTRMVPTGPAALRAAPIFERELYQFVMTGDSCAPGVFSGEDGKPLSFTVTVCALTTQEEIEVTRSVKNPLDLPFALAKKSLHKFNNQPLDDKKRGFLWEAFGPKGRQLVIYASSHVNSAGDEAVGKVQDGWES
jgi:hypothetical protein